MQLPMQLVMLPCVAGVTITVASCLRINSPGSRHSQASPRGAVEHAAGLLVIVACAAVIVAVIALGLTGEVAGIGVAG